MHELARANNSMDKGAIACRITTVQGEPVADAAVMITGDSPSHKDIAALTDDQDEYRHLINRWEDR